jgi:hypothetical protein
MALYSTRQNTTHPARAFAAACAAVALLAAAGCQHASTSAPEPPGGGRSFVLDYQVFASQIDTLLTAKGCDNLSCHGGGIRGTFELSPANDKDVALDFSQASLQVNGTDPAASPLLAKPLAPTAGGAEHAGDASFASTDDPGYQAIRAWIEAGEYR